MYYSNNQKINVLEELLNGTPIEEFAKKIKWINIAYFPDNKSTNRIYTISPKHTLEGVIKVLKKLDFTYNTIQEIKGIVVFKNNDYLTRFDHGWFINRQPKWTDWKDKEIPEEYINC